MFRLWVPLCFLFSGAGLASIKPEFHTVFISGEGGYELIRTPQVLTTDRGTLLAFAQGREGRHDQSGNDIILKRSPDGGKTWTDFQVIAEKGDDSLNSICVLQRRESGRILVVGCVIPAGYNIQDYATASAGMKAYMEKSGRADWPTLEPGFGEGAARVYLIASDDDGKTWTRRRDITRSTKRAKYALTCIPGPGLGIQLRHGNHAGRILIPCNQRWHDPRTGRARTLPYAIYSDDGGTNWHIGNLAEPAATLRGLSANETQFVERDDGSILLNAHTSGRATAISRDGGLTWSPLTPEPQLMGPACAAGFLKYSSAHDEDRSRILFSLPFGDKRSHGTIWMSHDGGETWPVSKMLTRERFAYSCLTRLPDGDIGCIYGGRTSARKAGVIFARFPLSWLEKNSR